MEQPDFSAMSDDDLDKALAVAQAKQGASSPKSAAVDGYDHLSDHDLDQLLAVAETSAAKGRDTNSFLTSLKNGAIEKVAEAGRFIDRYSGAPARAAIGAAQDGENPLSAAARQFGADPELAPTGQELARRAGVPDTSLSDVIPSRFTDSDVEAKEWLKFKRGGAADVSASGAAGLGIDIAADPTNLIPGVAISKGTELAGQGLRAAGRAASKVSAPTLKQAGDVAKAVTVHAGSTLTGLPKKNIAKYIERTPEVEKIIAKHGGDMTLAADELRDNLQKAIQTKIASLNDDVKKAIANAPAGSSASNEAIINSLEVSKRGVNAKLYPGTVAEIDDLIAKIKSLSTAEVDSMLPANARAELLKKVGPETANEAKRFLQDQAKGSYVKNGQLFTSSAEASRAAKGGAREARKIEMQLAPDTIAPNKDLAKLHRYQETANKNLIAPGKTESALLAAGSGSNARNAKNLREIGEMTGYNALDEAELLSSAKAFAEPGYLPVDSTGKSATRMALAAVTGSWIGGPFGTAAGIALTSPAVLKQAIKKGQASAGLIKSLAGGATELTDAVIEKAIKVAGTKEGELAVRSFEKAAKQTGATGLEKIAEQKEAPLKGEAKWASDGYEKVAKHTSGRESVILRSKSEMLSDPKLRRLMISASDLQPGSKAMANVIKEIEKIEGGKR